MCDFFSFCTIGGQYYYFMSEDIAAIKAAGNKDNLKFNSHASIAVFYGFKEDKSNKFEYNPYSQEFKVDQLNGMDDSPQAQIWVRQFFAKFKTHKSFLAFCRIYFDEPDWDDLTKKLGNNPQKDKILDFCHSIMDFDWFCPQAKPGVKVLQKHADMACAVFKTAKLPIKIIALRSPQDWSAARSAAESAAWSAAESAARSAAWSAARSAAWSAAESAARSAAWSAAWSAAHISVEDLLKKDYPTNPWLELMWFWKRGLYPIANFGAKEFVVYYVPKKRGDNPKLGIRKVEL
jgi:hypothetical protein